MATFFGHCLIVERDMFFLDRLKTEIAAKDSPLIITQTFKDALNALKKPQNCIKVVLVSQSFGMAEIAPFMAQVKQLAGGIPWILSVHQPRFLLSAEELAKQGFAAQLEKPEDVASILKLLKKIFPERHSWQGIEASEEEKNETLDLKDQDFMPIATDDFLLTDKCFFNVFVRLAPNKFIKILNAGDAFDSDFAEKYSDKKISSLWVPKLEHHQYTHLSEKNAASGIQRHSPDTARRIAHLGDNVAQALGRVGISEDNLLYADRFLGHSIDFLRQQRMQGNSYAALLKELCDAEHPAAVAVIAGLLASQLGFESTKAIKVVGLAALLHDIGIYHERPDFPAEDPLTLTGADVELYQRHAQEGAEILRKMELFDEVVIQAVAQHHEKHSKQAGHGTNLVGEIVSASDLFVHKVLQSKKPNVEHFLNKQLKDYRPQIEVAFRAILKKKTARQAV